MARVLMTLVGIGLLALGGWLSYLWWDALKVVLLALLALAVLLFGLVLLIFGLSEIAGARSSASPAAGNPEDESK